MTNEKIKALFREAVEEVKAAGESSNIAGFTESTVQTLFNYFLQVAVQEEQNPRVVPATGVLRAVE